MRSCTESFPSKIKTLESSERRRARAEMSKDSFPEIRNRVVELLVVSSERLEASPIVKYSALSLFSDRFCYRIFNFREGSGRDIDNWLLRPVTESSLQLFALISLWISSKMHDSRSPNVKSLKSLGDNMIKDQHFTTRDYVEAELVFMQVLEFEISVMDTPFGHLEDLHIQFIKISKIGEMMNFEACMDIMDLLYEEERNVTRHTDPSILAASILIASYLITVPKQMHEFPLLPWDFMLPNCQAILGIVVVADEAPYVGIRTMFSSGILHMCCQLLEALCVPTGLPSLRKCLHYLTSQIWTDIGETKAEKDRMLLELEKECLEIYQRKVDEAANTKARLHQSVAAKEAELATLMASLGELKINSLIPSEKKAASLKEKLAAVSPLLEDLRAERDERKKQFTYVKEQLDRISEEISGMKILSSNLHSTVCHKEEDLSLHKLSEYQNRLRVLQKEKADRVTKILEYVNEVHSLCAVLGKDFGKTVSDVHPSLHVSSLEQSTNTNLGNTVLEGLEQAILKLKLERKSRYVKLKNLASSLYEMWNLMDSPYEDKNRFSDLYFVAESSNTEITQPGLLTTEIIEQVSEEVNRLKTLKASRMKQLVMNKRSELEEICRVNHIEPDTNTTSEKVCALIDAGLMDPSELLSSIESQIFKAKQEAASRQDIMDRIGRWLSACEEEIWLEDYNLDANRYSAGRGAHLNLKRAERARVTVSKIPTILDILIAKTLAWEKEKGVMFLYDGVRLLSILEEYKLTRKHKEEAKRRSRDQKKLQDVLMTEKESKYGSRPSPQRSNSFRKLTGYPNSHGSMTPNPRRSSVGSLTPELQIPRAYSERQNGYFNGTKRLSTGPLNFVCLRKEDTLSCTSTSFCDSESSSQI